MLQHRKYKSGTRWCAWRWTYVILNARLYLRRLHIVQTPWFSIMLHWIPSPDRQPDLHDHPVAFVSWVIRGGYTEMTPEGVRVWLRWSMHLMRATDRHRIVETSPDTLTLVFAGPVVRPWGFHTTGGWVPWREYELT